MVRYVKSDVKVACRNGKLPLGEGAAGVCQRVMKIKVAQNKMSIRKKRKKALWRYGAVRRTACTKKVHRGDPEGEVGESKKTFRRKDIH